MHVSIMKLYSEAISTEEHLTIVMNEIIVRKLIMKSLN